MKQGFQEHAEISLHQLRVFITLRDANDWLTSYEIAKIARVSPRTSRAYCYYFVQAGLVDQIETFPGHRYQFSKMAEKRNQALFTRLHTAFEAVGPRVDSRQLTIVKND